jgi:hypothetical protein
VIATIEANNRAAYAAVVSQAWACGVEVLPLTGLQLELCSGDDVKVNSIINKYNVTILHREKMKIVTGDEL